MKKIALCLLLSQLLACTAVKSPTPDKLPETPQAALTQFPNQDEYYQNQIVEPIDKIVAYFDEEYKLTEDSSKARYYRVHLGNTKNGDVVVQDFYADTKTKQNSIILIDKVDLLNFNFNQLQSIRNPFTHSYSKKGKLIAFQLYEKGLLIKNIRYKNGQRNLIFHLEYDDKKRVTKAKAFRPNGQLLAETEGSCPDFPQVKTIIYDENQVKLAEQNSICMQNNDKLELSFYHENGQKISTQNILKPDDIPLYYHLFLDENGTELQYLPNFENRIKVIEKFYAKWKKVSDEWFYTLIILPKKLENDEE